MSKEKTLDEWIEDISAFRRDDHHDDLREAAARAFEEAAEIARGESRITADDFKISEDIADICLARAAELRKGEG
jgi:hypothetical protein